MPDAHAPIPDEKVDPSLERRLKVGVFLTSDIRFGVVHVYQGVRRHGKWLHRSGGKAAAMVRRVRSERLPKEESAGPLEEGGENL
jgi:hypothetical protein